MSSLTTRQQTEKIKRFKFLGTGAAGLAVTILMTGWLGLPIMGLSAYWGWDWFQYRLKNSMRF